MKIKTNYYLNGDVKYSGVFDSTEDNPMLNIEYPELTIDISVDEIDSDWNKFRSNLFPNNSVALKIDGCNEESDTELIIEDLNVNVNTEEVEITDRDGGTVSCELFNDEELPFSFLSGTIKEVFSSDPGRVKLTVLLSNCDCKLLNDLKS